MSAPRYISNEEGNRYAEIKKRKKSEKYLVLGGVDGEDEEGEGEPLLVTGESGLL